MPMEFINTGLITCEFISTNTTILVEVFLHTSL
jgi:hypothetical protein